MELKVRTSVVAPWARPFQSHLYGIERTALPELIERAKGFNRTFMELKAGNARMSCAGRAGFNRTFMELKVDNEVTTCYPFRSFNRTFMELKVAKAAEVGRATGVSIAPLWN